MDALLSVTYELCDFFFFNDTATTEIYTLSLHDALPISQHAERQLQPDSPRETLFARGHARRTHHGHRARGRRHRRNRRSEEHTSELQSRQYLVCRLLLEKKTTASPYYPTATQLPHCHYI